MRKKFFEVHDFGKTDAGTYENRIKDELLVDLIGGIDVSLLENDFILQDMGKDRGLVLRQFYQEKARAGIAGISEKIHIPVKAVKKKVNYLKGVLSGVAAAVLLGVAAAWFVKKSAV